MKKTRRKISVTAVWFALIFALTWALFANTLTNRFAFDDKSLIVENTFLQRHTPISTIFGSNYRAGSGFTGDGLYRPLVMLTYQLNAGKEIKPFPFHLFNVTLNALNAALLFLLLYLMFRNLAVAVMAGLLFGFHPLHTEAVANIAGRPEIMCTFFLVLSWLALERFRARWWAVPLGAALLFGALLSKETAVLFPFMALAADFALKRPVSSRSSLMRYGVLALAVAVYLAIRWSILGSTAAGLDPTFVDNPIAHSPVVERVATALAVFARYAGLVLFPLRLSSDYSYHQIPVQSSLFGVLPVAGLLLLIGMTAFAIWSRKRYPELFLAGVVFLLPYLLVSNLALPVGTIMGERLMYLPLAGFALAAGYALAQVLPRRKPLVMAVMGVVLVLFTIRTVTRNHDWYDDYSLFSADLHHASRSVKVLCNLGYLTGKDGRTEESMGYFRQALDIHPDYDEALRGYGKRLYDLKRFPESVEYYARAVQISPERPDFRTDYAIVLEKLNRMDEAERELMTVIRLSPNSPLPYQEMSAIKIARGEYGEALRYLERAAALGGDKRLILNNTAAAQFMSGDASTAWATVQRAESMGIRVNQEMAQTIRAALGQR